ncbi:MAG: diguanylate cyclase domain-containing protein [Cellulomonas sp.]
MPPLSSRGEHEAMADPDFVQRCLESLLSGPDAVIYVKDLASRFVLVSDATAAKHGMAVADLVGLTDADLFSAEHAEFAIAEERHIMTTGEATAYKEVHETWPDRPDSWAVTTKRPLLDRMGQIVGLVGISQDITGRVLAERSAAAAMDDLRASETRLRTVLDSSPDAITRHDARLRVMFANAAAAALLGVPVTGLIGRRLRGPVSLRTLVDAADDAAQRALRDGRQADLEVAVTHADGTAHRWFQLHVAPLRATDGSVESALVSTRDITEKKAAQEELARQALTDPVTGLANRVLLTERLTRALGRLADGETIAVIFVDLDRFKEVNDVHGHHIGDGVLMEVARRLSEVARRHDTVSRLGGDEFVVLCESLPRGEVALDVARRFVEAVSATFEVEGLSLHLSASVGVVPIYERTGDVPAVLRRADAAMYAAKREGGNRAHLADA